MSRFRLLLCLLAAALLPGAASARPRVVATTNFVGDVVARVGGPDIDLETLMGPGVDPHLYKPTARDTALLARADVVFYHGLMLEGKMAELFESLGRTRPVFAITADISHDRLLRPEQFAGHFDPHIWNDPAIWSLTPAVVARGLARVDPANAAAYEARAAECAAAIAAVGDRCRLIAAALPADSRIVVTSHDAFNYLGRAFDFLVIAPQGISTVSEAGTADIAKTIDLIRERRVRAIFTESSVSPEVVKRIAEQSGARVGGELFSDAMGGPGEMRAVRGLKFDTGTYEGMMLYNMLTIVTSLAADEAEVTSILVLAGGPAVVAGT